MSQKPSNPWQKLNLGKSQVKQQASKTTGFKIERSFSSAKTYNYYLSLSEPETTSHSGKKG